MALLQKRLFVHIAHVLSTFTALSHVIAKENVVNPNDEY